MGYSRSFDEKSTERKPICMFLRSKAIYVTGDPDPRSKEEEGSTRFNCWCNKTQHTLGPDDQLVDRDECCDGRECYLPRV